MVKCAGCGYLSVRIKVDSSLGEASVDFRERVEVAQGTDDKGGNQHPLHENIPLCFARCHYLGDAVKDIKRRDNPFEEVKEIIQKDIDCEEFTEWQQGFTPKEHRETIDREKMLKWQVNREDADRKWREKQDKKLVIIAGGFTILGALIGALIALLR